MKSVQRYGIGALLLAAQGLVWAQSEPEMLLDTQQCLRQLRPAAPQHGVSLNDFDRYTQQAQLLPSTVKSARGQPEGRETWWDYLAKTIDPERVDAGKAILADQGAVLDQVAARFEVDKEVMVAIFGVETNYGTRLGSTDVLNAWLTRACVEGKPLWKSNVYASLRLLRDGVVSPEAFQGSWSGAFGMTQFIPTSFFELAADGDGDGRIDLYHSLPDALASTANHLRKRRAQWQRGLLPLIEVKPAPDALRALGVRADPEHEYAARQRMSLSAWLSRGITAYHDSALTAAQMNESAWLIAPTGANGPAFLATRNFDAILHYNQSLKYAVSVSLLIDQLRGQPPIQTPWPTDDPGLSRAEIRALQQALLDLGHPVGTPDGIPGSNTRAAVAAEQRKRGWVENGRVGRKIYDVLLGPAAQGSSAG